MPKPSPRPQPWKPQTRGRPGDRGGALVGERVSGPPKAVAGEPFREDDEEEQALALPRVGEPEERDHVKQKDGAPEQRQHERRDDREVVAGCVKLCEVQWEPPGACPAAGGEASCAAGGAGAAAAVK